ncbi:general secretion pathway protein GspB [Burkholderiaceae bacterium UC74_6]
MSYILEALKRAEAERGRGAVPTLQSQSAAAPAEAAQKRPATRYVLVAAAGLVLLVLGALAARWWLQPAAPVSAATPAPAPAPAPVPAPAPMQPAQVKPVESQFLPPPPPPQTTQRIETRAAPAPVVAAPAPVVAAPKPAPVPAAAPAASTPAPALADLPDSFRRELPPLKIGGSMYSDTASARMLILNGIVYHEGDVLSPGLQLESIGTRRATLSYKGQRFSLDY